MSLAAALSPELEVADVHPFATDSTFHAEPVTPVPEHLSAPGRAGVDWELACCMLASGTSMPEVARELGCSRTTLWRALKDSPELRLRIREERTCLAYESEARLGGLRGRLVMAIEAGVRRGDTRLIIWLAERLRILGREFRRDDPERPTAAEKGARVRSWHENKAHEQKAHENKAHETARGQTARERAARHDVDVARARRRRAAAWDGLERREGIPAEETDPGQARRAGLARTFDFDTPPDVALADVASDPVPEPSAPGTAAGPALAATLERPPARVPTCSNPRETAIRAAAAAFTASHRVAAPLAGEGAEPAGRPPEGGSRP